MQKERQIKEYDPEETFSQIQLILAERDRKIALENSVKKGRLEFLLDPTYKKRLKIFSGATRQDPTNVLFAEIYHSNDVVALQLQPCEEPLEMLIKPGFDLSYQSVAKQTAEFVRDFFEEAAHLPIAIFTSIEAHRLDHPVTVFELPPLRSK